MIIAAVALIVVGPKDLRVLLRKLGQFVARMRGMASEFRASFDELCGSYHFFSDRHFLSLAHRCCSGIW